VALLLCADCQQPSDGLYVTPRGTLVCGRCGLNHLTPPAPLRTDEDFRKEAERCGASVRDQIEKYLAVRLGQPPAIALDMIYNMSRRAARFAKLAG
jgi:hypothetical protein